MYPILGRYGPFFLYSYTVVLGLGLAAGIGLSAWFVKKEKDATQADNAYAGWQDGLVIALLAALVGGRIGFVWANWSYYRDAVDEIVLVWQGGLSYHGALVCAVFALWFWSFWRNRNGSGQSFTAYAGLLVSGLALGHVFGWLACWLEGCSFGRETVLGLLTADLPDSFGVQAVRYQTQLMGLGLSTVIFVAALLLRDWMRNGRFFWLIFGLLSAGYGLVTFFRGDSMPMIGTVRLDTALAFGITAISLLALVFQKRESG